ncbi:MAG: protein kinase [Chloroflexi bacterium]|nr:protein kinase [Chloroflexota bacterium]
MSNPYISRGPVRQPEVFFGRTHELNEIAAFLRGNQSVSIVGPRKIGKTSLIFQLMRSEVWPGIGLDEHTLFVYLDCEVLGDGSHQAIFGTFAAEMAAALDERGLPPEPALAAPPNKPTRLSFEAAIRKLNQRGLRVVFVLDEFERLSNNADLDVNFFNALRSAAGRYQLAFLTASARPLIDLTYSGRSQEILSSPFFNIFAPLFLGLLPEAEARKLIREPAQAAAPPFSSELEDFLYELAGGHPLALQVACFHALELPPENRKAEEIEQRAMQELAAHFEYYWRNLSAAEQDTIRHIGDAASREANDTTLRGILRSLVQKCLLIQDGGLYRHPSRAWANFLAAQAPAPLSQISAGGLLSGTRLGTYEVIGLLSRGGMAEVYKGRHPRLERTVAIKILPASLAAEADFRQRFEREARAVAALKHPNIVQVFDFGDAAGLYYMVMEFLDGIDLAIALRHSRALSPAQVRPIARDVAGALDYAHSQGLVHRDIKPSNVMLEIISNECRKKMEAATSFAQIAAAFLLPASSRAVLTDFGIAKIVSGANSATKSAVVGTVDYMAPEQIRASREVDSRADVYALGVMLYQMFTGVMPFTGDNPGAIMMAHLQQPPPDPRAAAPDLPEAAALIILRALAKDPDDRPRTAGELAEAL